MACLCCRYLPPLARFWLCGRSHHRWRHCRFVWFAIRDLACCVHYFHIRISRRGSAKRDNEEVAVTEEKVSVAISDLKVLIDDKNVVVIDVRSIDEFEEGHIWSSLLRPV